MGAARIMPVQTEFTNSERIRQDRLQAHAVEAAEQCGGTFVPEVYRSGTALIVCWTHWPEGRQLMFCNEAEVWIGPAIWRPMEKGQPWAILIGPRRRILGTGTHPIWTALPYAHVVSPRSAYSARGHSCGSSVDDVAAGAGGIGRDSARRLNRTALRPYENVFWPNYPERASHEFHPTRGQSVALWRCREVLADWI